MANEAAGSDSDNFQVSANSDQYLTFILNGEEYGVDILRVQEIKGWDSATPIPNTPDYVRGVINLRGTIVPIIDLRARFGLERVPYGPTTVVIVLKVMHGNASRIMGIVVDAVSEVYNVSQQDLKPAPEFGGAVRVDFVKGLATVDKKMVIILAIDELLNSDAMAVANAE
ncbi:MAG: purine-binding chemotaxis protein CheW [Gammaproteobacteria bacterium]|nr:purine-binding chemotaxis protein CheW [Gammaproteobacteria bacterium]